MSLVDLPVFRSATPEGGELITTLVDLYPRNAQLTHLVRLAGIPQGGINFERSNLAIWPDVLTTAATLGRLRALIQQIADDPNSKAYADYFRGLLDGGAAPAGDNPYNVAMLAVRKALVDRRDLRVHLKELAGDDGARVLLVSGNPGFGKSYTWFFIAYLARRTGAFTPYLVDASRRAGFPLTAYEVMADIAGQLGWPMPPEDAVAQPATAVRKLVAWLINRSRTLDQPIWLVFDGFVEESSDPSARDLLGELALAASRFELGAIRVSLLEYSGQLTPEVDMDALKEPLERPTREHWTEFFRVVAEQRGFAPTAEALEALVTTLCGPDGTGEETSLTVLARTATGLAQDAFGEADR